MDLRVKELCKERGMLMEDLAQILGVTRITLTRNINGNPTMETLQKIATALNVQVWELFTASTTGEINGFVEYRGTIYKIQSREDLQQLNDLVNK
ncbi:MAG: helix-turn-helix transcriptional regulator [Bacteroidales bacterium]|nr:helix-turn-helix transcriptional regulator [Bacteroidales bacterium]